MGTWKSAMLKVHILLLCLWASIIKAPFFACRCHATAYRIRQWVLIGSRIPPGPSRLHWSGGRRFVATSPRGGLLGPSRSGGNVSPKWCQCQCQNAQRRDPFWHLRGSGHQRKAAGAQRTTNAVRPTSCQADAISVDANAVHTQNLVTRQNEHDQAWRARWKVVFHSVHWRSKGIFYWMHKQREYPLSLLLYCRQISPVRTVIADGILIMTPRQRKTLSISKT